MLLIYCHLLLIWYAITDHLVCIYWSFGMHLLCIWYAFTDHLVVNIFTVLSAHARLRERHLVLFMEWFTSARAIVRTSSVIDWCNIFQQNLTHYSRTIISIVYITTIVYITSIVYTIWITPTSEMLVKTQISKIEKYSKYQRMFSLC